MFYEENDSSANEFETMSSEDDDFLNELEELTDELDYTLNTHLSCFYFLFHDESGPFRRTFPEESMSDLSTPPPDLTYVLHDAAMVEAEDHLRELESQRAASVTNPEPGTKSSRASRFLDENPGACLLIAVDKAVNRSQLKEKHASEFPGIDFIVGYVSGEPTGWALLMDTDAKLVSAMQVLYPIHRFATDEDRYMFVKSRSTIEKDAGSSPQVSAYDPQKVLNKAFLKRWGSKANLARHIESIGGVGNAIFVSFDAEAVLVSYGSIPLPLEIALVPVVKNEKLPPFHCFLHPGHVEDCVTAIKLSCGLVDGAHCIPFKCASFLRRDYAAVAGEINRFLSCKQVVLVNKGTLMDVHALRWVFAAARALENEGDGALLEVPPLLSMPCYSFDVVWEFFSDEDVKKSYDNLKSLTKKPCSYHRKISEAFKEEVVAFHSAHCALEDAETLCDVLRPLIQRV
ncbi:hypothetical protein TRVL_07893 [Trypanosoma vivax]|nr:hypothetical protein TRVL_07893 [Trypanosoma vivax]